MIREKCSSCELVSDKNNFVPISSLTKMKLNNELCHILPFMQKKEYFWISMFKLLLDNQKLIRG